MSLLSRLVIFNLALIIIVQSNVLVAEFCNFILTHLVVFIIIFQLCLTTFIYPSWLLLFTQPFWHSANRILGKYLFKIGITVVVNLLIFYNL